MLTSLFLIYWLEYCSKIYIMNWWEMLPSTLNSRSNLSKQLTQDLNHWKLAYIIFVKVDAHHSISWAVISRSLLCIYGSNLHWILDLHWKIDLSELSAFMGASSRCFLRLRVMMKFFFSLFMSYSNLVALTAMSNVYPGYFTNSSSL